MIAHAEFRAQTIHVDCRGLLRQGCRALFIRQFRCRSLDLLQHAASRVVAFRMNPRRIERILAATDLQKAGRLHERRFAKPSHFHQLFAQT